MAPKYSQHYREEWEKMREFKDWLSPVKDDATKAYCKYWIGTDNASSMTGVNNGVHSLLKSETGNNNLVLVRCLCHSLQLAITHASEETLPRNIEFLIRETHNWFSHSSNRQLFYKELYKTINCGKEPLKITQMCNTRWLSIEPAVRRIVDQWLELKTHFEIMKQKENCYMAEMLYSMYNDPINHLFLLYLLPILDEVQKVNKNFEINDRDPTKLLNDLVELVESVARRILMATASARVNILTDNITSYLDPSPYMGYNLERRITEYQLSPESVQNLRHRCKQFTLKLVQEMRSRMPVNIQTLRKMNMFSVRETLKAIKPEIVDIAQEFGCNAVDIERIVVQWRNISHIDWKNKKSTIEFWSEVCEYKDCADNNPFHELASLVMSILCLPHSNAEVERVFSQMNVVKTKLRNRMSLTTLNSIMYVRYGLRRSGKCCNSYNIPDDVLKHIKGIKEHAATDDSGPSTSQQEQDEQVDDLQIYFEIND
ncbi:uncharacterized protein LOC121736556 [Aricia agestis]|uniref:uncharacterized protein LOC121729542 n=1 Tax=Aricia agestis TaxID=91739 RepID=UPI001C20965F|nr:uncharacterized protein LOC121729542 [Aricia agestis]XP_041983773.1 uncharacterized protein LOC121736556 [Aricia agestis]